MGKVVIINQNSGYLTIDIANAFASHFEKVILIAGLVKPMERELDSTVKIQKIIKYNRESNIKRLFTWVWGSIQIFFLLLLKYRHYEVYYITNPPMAYFASLLLKNRFSIIVYDTYPDALKNIGIKENNIVYKYWSKWNKKLFRKADKIITLSMGMAKQLSFYVELSKIKVIPNWSGSEKFSPIKKELNSFIKDNLLEGKFIVLYSGNMGYMHSVETIIEVAKKLEKEIHICFLLIGEGQKKEKLVQLIKQYDLKNCVFLTWQPVEVLPFSLASANLSVITLNDESADLGVPSKTYNLLAVGSPLLCISPDHSVLSSLVEKYENGKCFKKESVNEIASFIVSLAHDNVLQKKLSDKSLIASKDFHYSNALKYLEN